MMPTVVQANGQLLTDFNYAERAFRVLSVNCFTAREFAIIQLVAVVLG